MFLRYTAAMTGHAIPVSDQGLSAVILAGGESRRLGTDKALLELDGQSLLVRMVSKLTMLSDDLVVVTSNPRTYEHLGLEARLVPDERPGHGALMGIYSGLRAATHERAAVVACDMPFVSIPLLRHMGQQRAACDVVIPRFDDMVEPLHAIYGKRCLPFMADALARDRRQIVAFFDSVQVCYARESTIDRFDPLRAAFFNINSAADWRLAQEMISRPGFE